MTTLQLNAEMLRLMGVVAEDEDSLKHVVKYLKNFLAKKKDPTLMTKEEFFEKIDHARQQVREGKVTRLLPGETIEDLLKRKGYAV